jgi:hypothetical protein
MIRRAALFILMSAGPAWAEPQCQGVTPLPGPHPPPAQVVEQLALAMHGRTLSLWPLGGTTLNPQAGVAITFARGETCVSTFTEAGRDGIRLDANAPVASVDIAVCAADGGLCIPIRAVLKP